MQEPDMVSFIPFRPALTVKTSQPNFESLLAVGAATGKEILDAALPGRRGSGESVPTGLYQTEIRLVATRLQIFDDTASHRAFCTRSAAAVFTVTLKHCLQTHSTV